MRWRCSTVCCPRVRAASACSQGALQTLLPDLQHWAGPDQAQALSLCEWLYHRLEALDAFMPSPPPAAGSAGASLLAGPHCTAGHALHRICLLCLQCSRVRGRHICNAAPLPLCLAAAARQQRSEGVLRALAAAAETLRQWEFVQQHGAWVEAHQEELPPAVVEYWRGAQQASMPRGGRPPGAACCCRPSAPPPPPLLTHSRSFSPYLPPSLLRTGRWTRPATAARGRWLGSCRRPCAPP